jgi:hypothetical protein
MCSYYSEMFTEEGVMSVLSCPADWWHMSACEWEKDLRILVSIEMVRVFTVGASGMCTTVFETHLRYIITTFNIT